jgi:hypothetical protein
MTDSRVGIAAVAFLAAMPAIVAAQSTTAPRVQVTRSGTQVTIAAKADAWSISQTLTPTTFDLRIGDAVDRVRFVGDKTGRLRIDRGGRTLVLTLLEETPVADLDKVKAMLAGSSALARFDRLMASDWARAAREAAAFDAPHAIVALLQGNAAPLEAVVQRARLAGEPRITTVAQQTASWCWRSYERDVLTYTYELESCVAEATWSINPLRISWCAYSYNIKASLAFIWLLDCSGY